jgi:hypothetical protein
VNVTLNRTRQITRYFCGDVMAAHAAGCAFAKQKAMVACAHPFPIVLTTNAGYPLDQNLYQAVKGMHAAMQVVEPDGLILAAARCTDGFPSHGNFRRLLFAYPTPRALLDAMTSTRPRSAAPTSSRWPTSATASLPRWTRGVMCPSRCCRRAR